jgi:multiple sugar transport system ATP-binding protein
MVDVTEWLGDSQYAYIPFDAPEDVTTQLRDLSRELDSDQLRTQAVVSIDAASRMREGHEAEFWLDTSKVHIFDPKSGDNLTRDPEAGAELTRMAEEERAGQLEEARHEAATTGRTADAENTAQNTVTTDGGDSGGRHSDRGQANGGGSTAR